MKPRDSVLGSKVKARHLPFLIYRRVALARTARRTRHVA